MDANMQQIMVEAQQRYQSRTVTPMSSPMQPSGGSPHLDSIIYYERDDTPRRRKKIFDPRYRDAQHDRHMTRLHSASLNKAGSVDPHQRISQLNQNVMMGGTVPQNQFPSQFPNQQPFISGVQPMAAPNMQSSTTLDRQVTNLFATALRQQQPFQNPPINPLSAYPMQNQVAQAFITNLNNESQRSPDPLLGMIGGLIANDIHHDNRGMPSQPNPMNHSQPLFIPGQELLNSVGMLGTQNLGSYNTSGAQSDFARRGFDGRPPQETNPAENLFAQLALGSQHNVPNPNNSPNNLLQAVLADAVSKTPPPMAPMTHQQLFPEVAGFSSAIQADILRSGTSQTIPVAPVNPPQTNLNRNYDSQQVINNMNPLRAVAADITQSTQQKKPSESPFQSPPVIHMVNSADFQHHLAQIQPVQQPVQPQFQSTNSVMNNPKAFEGAIRRQANNQSSNLIINQQNSTLQEQNVFNTTNSVNRGQPAPPSQFAPAAQKEPQPTAEMIQRVNDIQKQIDKLSSQLKETELKDSIRQERLQSVLSAKQKEVSRREAEIKKNETMLMQMKDEKNKRAAHIEQLKLEVERLRRQNRLRKRYDTEHSRGPVFESFGKDLVSSKEASARGPYEPKGDYSWVSDRLINSVAGRGRNQTEVTSDRYPRSNHRILGGVYAPRSRSPSPTNHSIIQKVYPYSHPDMAHSVPENLFTTALRTPDNYIVRVPVTPIMAQAPIKTITTITPVNSYQPLDRMVVPPLIISPNANPPAISTVYQQHPSLHKRESPPDPFPSFIRTHERTSFAANPPTSILIQDRDSN